MSARFPKGTGMRFRQRPKPFDRQAGKQGVFGSMFGEHEKTISSGQFTQTIPFPFPVPVGKLDMLPFEMFSSMPGAAERPSLVGLCRAAVAGSLPGMEEHSPVIGRGQEQIFDLLQLPFAKCDRSHFLSAGRVRRPFTRYSG